MLARVRAALDVAGPQPPATRARYRATSTMSPAERLALFAERCSEYGATVAFAADDAEVGRLVADACARHAADRIVAPPDVPAEWLARAPQALLDAPPLAHGALADIPGAVTGSAVGIAQTGTIVLDGGTTQGRRALTLLPDLHICVVRADAIVGTVPEAIRRLTPRPRRLTFVSGPSATSDIELVRVEGVHGPRRLEVIVHTGAHAPTA